MPAPTLDALVAEAQQLVTDLQAFQTADAAKDTQITTLTAANAALQAKIDAAKAALA